MTHQLKQRELVINLSTGEYDIKPITDPRIIGPVDYGWVRYNQAIFDQNRNDPLIMTWGGGPLAGSRIPGTRRLVFTSFSPLWEGFYISSFGGGSYIMHRVGVDFISIVGAAPEDSILLLNHNDGQISARIEPIKPDVIWAGYASPDGEMLSGFYALQQALYDRYRGEYDQDWMRIFTVGPASRITNQGIIGSNHIREGKLTQIDDWAGRGGLGSQMLQQQRLVACIFGGDWEDPDLKDSKEIDQYFQTYYGNSMIKVDLGATEKYRFAPGFQTGGTFGVNMHTIEDKLMSFNYTSIYQSSEARLDQAQQFITNHYLKQFNDEIIKTKNFLHCGEPCAVVCKKFDRVYKKDYEPYQALGPLCGIFDQRAAEELNHFADAMGFDAIQIGGTVSWIMEMLREGVIKAEDYGLPPVDQMNFNFSSNPAEFNLEIDSKRNAVYAESIIRMILFSPAGTVFQNGIRAAALSLQQSNTSGLINPSPLSLAVYNPHGEKGGLTPNQYWVPGMFAPMPMMGKYYVYYGLDFVPPKQLGKQCVYRMIYELFNDNSGVCRFHRKWVETIIDEIISAHYDFPVNYIAHQFRLARQIYEHEKASIRFWENERTIDLIYHHLDGWRKRGLQDEQLIFWIDQFEHDKWQAARNYWGEILSGIEEAFNEGAGAVPSVSPPFKGAQSETATKQN
ncbi:MAG TPA: aldehyde ferredoxin oxidoreductase N-terminal domain-containing protein [Anaerolineaceae bacterium]